MNEKTNHISIKQLDHLERLATQLKLGSDSRKSIFMIIMTANDPIEAAMSLLELKR